MNLHFDKAGEIIMKTYEKPYLDFLKINSIDVNLLVKIGLPKLTSYVQDCFLPLDKFYALEFEKTSYWAIAACSDLFPERTFIAYDKENYEIVFFSKNQQDKLEKKFVNSSLSNFLKSRDIYQTFKFEMNALYKEVIIKKERYLDDPFFTSSVIKLMTNLISNLHEIEIKSYQSYFQYWPDILGDITMNYSDHFQYVNEQFELLSKKKKF